MRKKSEYPKVSIIIPLYIETEYFHEAVRKCLELDYLNFEVLIGVDQQSKIGFSDKRVKVFKTGFKRTGPGEKRDIGIINAKGEFIAFLDDDSYPAKDWLKKAVFVKKEKNVVAVCGPGLTPPGDSFWQKITGAILASPLGSGPYSYRFKRETSRFVDDYPAYNLLVDRNALLRVGGFGTKFYGGEDTALCLKLINAGEKILYHPDIVVYHHRRKFPFEYIKQVGNVGLHRGYFVKRYPQTSLRLSYFSPAILTLLLPVLVYLILANNFFLPWMVLFSAILYMIIVIFSLRENSFIIGFLLPCALLVSHVSYGYQFIKGLLVAKLEQ